MQMPVLLQPWYFALAMLIGMVICLEIGWRLGKRRRARDPGLETGVGPLEGAVFALFGLLLAFTFSGAAGRFDERRDRTLEEANAMSTAYQRLDLLPEARQPVLRALFREYVQARIVAYRNGADLVAVAIEHRRTVALQDQIWQQSLAAAGETGSAAVMTLMVQSLSEMFSITTMRLAELSKHPPSTIFGMLFGLGLVASLMAGYGLAESPHRPWFYSWSFALVISSTVYVIMDLEYPRLAGLIRIDATDQLLVGVLHTMK